MSDRFHEGQLAYNARQNRGTALGRMGVIYEVDNANSIAKVNLMPEDIPVAAGWLPTVWPFASGSVTFRAGLSAGTQVWLEPQEGSADGYVIVGAVHSDTMPTSQSPTDIDGDPVDLGEDEVIIKTPKCVIRIDGDGNVLIKSTSEVRLQAPTIRSKADWQHDGDFTATGQVKDFHSTLDSVRQHSNTHHHSGVQTGSGTSGPPTTED